jgi:cell division protein FtsL
METGTAVRRVSPFLLVIIMIVLVLSLASIYQGFRDLYGENPDATSGSLYLTIGVTTLAMSTYLLFQTKRRAPRLGLEILPLNTTILCQKCGFRNIRDFQRGDYIYKQMEEPCPKCSEKAMTIGSIFREVKDKEKT